MDKERLEHLRQVSRDFDGSSNPGALLFAMAVRECVAEIDRLQSPPPRPAIPEDVRKALKYALAFASADAALSDHPSVQALSNDFGFARAWLAQCPTATVVRLDQPGFNASLRNQDSTLNMITPLNWEDGAWVKGKPYPAGEGSPPGVPTATDPKRKFAIGDRVEKRKGSSWRGKVVGFYSTSLTPDGCAVESENEPGSVQIYPVEALQAWEGPTATDKAVCPQCGYQRFRIDKNIAECISCGHKFEVILVISPPREVKP